MEIDRHRRDFCTLVRNQHRRAGTWWPASAGCDVNGHKSLQMREVDCVGRLRQGVEQGRSDALGFRHDALLCLRTLGRPEITPHNWISEQSRSRMPDEGLGIAAIGLGNPQDREGVGYRSAADPAVPRRLGD